MGVGVGTGKVDNSTDKLHDHVRDKGEGVKKSNFFADVLNPLVLITGSDNEIICCSFGKISKFELLSASSRAPLCVEEPIKQTCQKLRPPHLEVTDSEIRPACPQGGCSAG